MHKILSYTPPRRRADAVEAAPVRTRHVLHIPGYDPEAKSRARSLFVRELIRYGRRFGLKDRTVSPSQDLPDVPALRWTIQAAAEGWATHTTYDVLRWDDLVEADFRRAIGLGVLGRLVSSMIAALATGLTFRLFRMNWIFACVTIYPAVMVLLLALVAGGAGWLVAWVLQVAAAPVALAGIAGGLAAIGIVLGARREYAKRYVWHLLRDWLFNWDLGCGSRPDYAARVERFAAHLVRLARATEADEILVVGHSSGAAMAVETVARALALDPQLGRRGPDVAVLTIGTSMPVAALNAKAVEMRRNIARVMAAPDVLWVEYQAPQDWLNAAGFNPIDALSLDVQEADCTNPVIRSARFREITSDATYRTMLKSPFRLHFQFLMANDLPGEYDFILTTVGPMRLAERVFHPERALRLAAKAQPEAALADA